MRFLHTGDLHLDSPFCSTDALRSDKRRAMQREALGRIFELAKREGCELILIAGDLFDGKYVTPETEKYVTELFGGTDIPVVIAPGNHDPYINGSFYKKVELPDNVYVFSSDELQCFELPTIGTRVWGYAFTSSVMTRSPLNGQTPPEDDGYLNLLCAHADITSPISRYCPLTVGDIELFGIDYAALGHNHNRYDTEASGRDHIRYCGFAEGRSFDELGDGGVYIVDVEYGRAPVVERRIVSTHRYEIEELDISELNGEAEIKERIAAVCARAAQGSPAFMRLILTGMADSSEIPEPRRLEEELSVNGLTLEIRDMTIPAADASALESDISIRGAFYRTLYSGLIDKDPKVRERTALALQIGLSAIDGKSIVGGKREK